MTKKAQKAEPRRIKVPDSLSSESESFRDLFANQPKVDLKAFENVLKGDRIFTREFLERVDTLLQKAQDPDNQDKICLKDTHGVEHVIWDPSRPCRNILPNWRWYWHLALHHNSPEEYKGQYIGWFDHAAPVPVAFAAQLSTSRQSNPRILSNAREHLCRRMPTYRIMWKMWKLRGVRKSWEEGTSRRALLSVLKENALKSRPIKRIVCFALGRLETDSSYAQHLAVCDIADTLQSLYTEADGGPVEALPIYSQDPHYSPAHRKLLKTRLPHPITVLDDPKGFLAIDQNTLVMSAFCPVHVLEIVADLLAPSTPAAILTNEHEAYVAGQKEWLRTDRMTPRAVELLEKFEGWSFDEFTGRRGEGDWMHQMALWLATDDSRIRSKS